MSIAHDEQNTKVLIKTGSVLLVFLFAPGSTVARHSRITDPAHPPFSLPPPLKALSAELPPTPAMLLSSALISGLNVH